MLKLFPTNAVDEKGFWSQLTADQPEELIGKTMELLLESSHMLFANISALPPGERGTPDQFALVWILSAFNQRLAYELNSNMCLNFQEWLSEWDSSPHAVVTSQKIDQLSSACLEYLQSRNTEGIAIGPCMLQGQGLQLVFNSSGDFQMPTFMGDLAHAYGLLYLFSKFPELVQKVFEKFPELKGTSYQEVLEKILPLITTDLFPVSYRVLYEQQFLFGYFITNPDLSKIRRQKGILPGNMKFDIFRTAAHTLNMDIAFDGTESYFADTSNPTGGTGCFHIDLAKHTSIKHPGYTALFDFKSDLPGICHTYKFEDIAKGKYLYFFDCKFDLNFWLDGPINSAIYADPIPGLSHHETKEIKLMCSKSALFIPNLLSYLKAHPENLLDRDFQLLLYHLIFTTNALDDSLERFPDAGDKLAAELITLAEQHQKLGNLPLHFFLLELLDKMSAHMPSLAQESRHILETTLQTIDSSNIGTKRLKALGYAQLISGYSDQYSFSEEEVKKITLAYFRVKAFGYQEQGI